MTGTHDLVGQHYEADRWLYQDDDFYYLYSVDEPEIWISYRTSFDKWGTSTDFVVQLWYWEVDFSILNSLCWSVIETDINQTGLKLDLTERYRACAPT